MSTIEQAKAEVQAAQEKLEAAQRAEREAAEEAKRIERQKIVTEKVKAVKVHFERIAAELLKHGIKTELVATTGTIYMAEDGWYLKFEGQFDAGLRMSAGPKFTVGAYGDRVTYKPNAQGVVNYEKIAARMAEKVSQAAARRKREAEAGAAYKSSKDALEEVKDLNCYRRFQLEASQTAGLVRVQINHLMTPDKVREFHKLLSDHGFITKEG